MKPILQATALIRTATIAFLLMMGTMHLYAQLPEPCTPDCPGSTWQTVQNKLIEVPGFPGCYVVVFYVERIACPPANYHDVQILSVAPLSSSACDAFRAYIQALLGAGGNDIVTYTKTLHDYISGALVASLFAEDYQQMTQQEKQAVQCPGGMQQWRVARGSCVYYRRDGACCWSIQRCPTSFCCLQLYNVCWNTTTNQAVVTRQPYTNPITGECGPTPSDAWGAGGLCIPICDDYH